MPSQCGDLEVTSCFLQETLPGFKWIGNRIQQLTEAGNDVIFSFEESIGSDAIVSDWLPLLLLLLLCLRLLF